MHEDKLDGEGRNFGDEDASEGIGEGGVYADQREGCIERVIFVKLDSEILRRLSLGENSVMDLGPINASLNFCKLHEWSSPG